MRVKPCWTTTLFYLCGAAFFIVLSIFEPYVNSQVSVTGWPAESAWTLKANKTVWLQVSIGSVTQTGYLEIMMFPELMPKAVESFVQLCIGTTNCKPDYI
jgi:hypothetical protein